MGSEMCIRDRFSPEEWREMVRKVTLQIMDSIWVEHLEVMQYTRSSVNLRAYGQKDPLNEYRKEGNRLFKEMNETILYRIAHTLPRIEKQVVEKEEQESIKEKKQAQESGGSSAASSASRQPRTSDKTFGRNDVVTLKKGEETQEVKFKKAEALLAEGWELVLSLIHI